jgi:glycosyltransferase involved in cell wall biosynthesis
LKILFVSLFLPQEKAYHAGGRYVFELLRQLSQRHEIHLATRLQEDELPCLEELRPFCREIFPYTYSAKEKRGLFDLVLLARNYLGFSLFADRLIRQGSYDLAQVEWIDSAICIRKGRTPMVLDAHDVISKPLQRSWDRSSGARRIWRGFLYRFARGVEKLTMGRFDRIVTLSAFDRDYLLKLHPDMPVTAVPIPAGLDLTKNSYPRRKNMLLFLASYKFRPKNVEGAGWFYREVFPLVREAVPDAEFVIAGYGPPEELTALEQNDPGVRVTGFVDDTDELYKSAAVFVAPILYGGGIIVKILDAMAAGAPVVTTTYGNEVIGAVPERDILIADTPRAFADAVIALLRNGVLAEKLGGSGHDFVAGNFSLEAVMAKMEGIYGTVKAGNRERPGTGNRKGRES